MALMSIKLTKGSANVQGVGYLLSAASGSRRFRVSDWLMGCDASPADNTFTHIVQRATTAPTATTRTPQPLDLADTLASPRPSRRRSTRTSYAPRRARRTHSLRSRRNLSARRRLRSPSTPTRYAA